MNILSSKAELAHALQNLRAKNGTVGFVPTMGALHEGHLSLIKIACELTDVVVVSIFVNPTQFNNPRDLERYPRPVDRDVELLKETNCDILFMPSVAEMYGQQEDWFIDLGNLENILEGKFRPGHYQGVTQIVKKLLDSVNPDFVFLGQKDYQQVMVLEHMVKMLQLPVELVMCPIVREKDGLALSSRNIHLSAYEHQNALVLSQVLFRVKKDFSLKSIEELKSEAWRELSEAEGLQPEYFEICDSTSLEPVTSKVSPGIVALVAANVGETRLIDNIILK